jgi:hypothetical protein
MEKENLSSREVKELLIKTLKSNENKVINKAFINKYNKLINKLYTLEHFIDFDEIALSKGYFNELRNQRDALYFLKSGFFVPEKGGYYRISDISFFSSYKDGSYKMTFDKENIMISEKDFKILSFIFKF